MFKKSIEQFVLDIVKIGDEKMVYQRIRDLREDHDLTQAQVGEKINVPQRTYAYYESGQRMIPPHILCALADLYHVSVDYLLGRTDKK
jgi:transcriptional regulator with XRE-family HTH domain